MKKMISIVTPLYNEEDNVAHLCARVAKTVQEELPQYRHEHICIDNHSTDDTVARLRAIAKQDQRLKIIVNAWNFGYERSALHGILQASGDAVALLSGDLQDPPEILPQLISQWQAGYKVTLSVKQGSEESALMYRIRAWYYHLIARMSDVPLVKNATGSGLFDRRVIDILREIKEPCPYLRGLVCELGFPVSTVSYIQPKRQAGKTTYNFFSLCSAASNGITKYSNLPLRLMTFIGFTLSFISLLIACGYFLAKLLFWNSFVLGQAPILIGIFFFAAVQMFCLGVLGEYIGAIHTYVRNMPKVIEKERINF